MAPTLWRSKATGSLLTATTHFTFKLATAYCNACWEGGFIGNIYSSTMSSFPDPLSFGNVRHAITRIISTRRVSLDIKPQFLSLFQFAQSCLQVMLLFDLPLCQGSPVVADVLAFQPGIVLPRSCELVVLLFEPFYLQCALREKGV